MRTTHTYALLEVSPQAFDEIATLLREAGYDHVFVSHSDGDTVIDMHGIALERGPAEDPVQPAAGPRSARGRVQDGEI